MKNYFKFAAVVAAVMSVVACNKNEVMPDSNALEQISVPTTKSYGYKYPIMAAYVETNDTNPLNAGDYMFPDGEPFFSIVELFAANIHRETFTGEIEPTLRFNDKLANILENEGVDTYVRPLQDKGIKVLLTVIGNWQGIGLANMNYEQTTKFAKILAYTVEHYGLDGIGFGDEYADYSWPGSGAVNSTSYSEIITKLHNLMPADKLITVFDWGYTNTISSEAAACIDYAYHGYYGSYHTSSRITGMTADRWAPCVYNLGQYSSASTVRTHAIRAKDGGYGAIMTFNIRQKSDKDPRPTLQAMSDGLGRGTVTCVNGNRSRDVVIDPDGYTITYDMAIDGRE